MRFLEDVALMSDTDEYDEKVDAVTLITLHAAKGLEFPVVFITGMEEGLLPHIRSFDDPAQMEEERRLAYVGVTRAKDRLYLLRAFRRALHGAGRPQPAVALPADIPPELLRAEVGRQRSTLAGAARLDALSPGAAPSRSERRRRPTEPASPAASASATPASAKASSSPPP